MRVVVVRDVAHVIIDVVLELEVRLDHHRELAHHVIHVVFGRGHAVMAPHDHRGRTDLALGDPTDLVLVEPLGDPSGLAEVAVVAPGPFRHGRHGT